jgi:hypothetical protein
MKRIFPGLATLMCAASMPAMSQQLQPPIVPAYKPVPTQSGVGPQLEPAQSVQVPKVAVDPAQRPQSSSPIPGTGPAKQVPVEQAATRAKQGAANVFDSSGMPVNGMIQVAPNRVYDPATGLYHWTRAEGQQQKLID